MFAELFENMNMLNVGPLRKIAQISHRLLTI